jgi:hypothetical protein
MVVYTLIRHPRMPPGAQTPSECKHARCCGLPDVKRMYEVISITGLRPLNPALQYRGVRATGRTLIYLAR